MFDGQREKSGAVFSPDGRSIATYNRGELRLVDAESGILRLRIGTQAHTPAGEINPVWINYFVSTACFSMDGSKLASGGRDGACHVWDSSTGALLRTITVSPHTLLSLAPGGDWVRWARENLGMAFAMGHHPRLGEGSRVLQLEGGVVRMILDRL